MTDHLHHHSDTHKQNLTHRLKIVKGHIDKVIEMVEKDDYCLDIIQQTQAVKSSLEKVSEVLLENHLKTCVREAITQEKGVDEKIKEVLEAFRRK